MWFIINLSRQHELYIHAISCLPDGIGGWCEVHPGGLLLTVDLDHTWATLNSESSQSYKGLLTNVLIIILQDIVFLTLEYKQIYCRKRRKVLLLWNIFLYNHYIGCKCLCSKESEHIVPWLVWLHWLEHHPITKRLRVRFLVRTHT